VLHKHCPGVFLPAVLQSDTHTTRDRRNTQRARIWKGDHTRSGGVVHAQLQQRGVKYTAFGKVLWTLPPSLAPRPGERPLCTHRPRESTGPTVGPGGERRGVVRQPSALKKAIEKGGECRQA
jgi:hypothetical protein